MTEFGSEIATANQFLMSPFRMDENGDIDDNDTDERGECEGEARGSADEVLSYGNAFELENEPESKPHTRVSSLPSIVAVSSQMPSTSALAHLFRFRSAFNRGGMQYNNYEFLPNHLFVWMYMHQPVIRRNIPDDPKYAFIRYMDEVEMSIAILGGDKFVDLRDATSPESQLLAITQLEYNEFRRKLFRMGVDISACDTRRCRSCNAYLGFLNVPYSQF